MNPHAPRNRYWSRVADKPSPTEVSNLLCASIAVLLTVGFYASVVQAFRQTYFGQLMAERGWVQHAITFLTFWALVALALKRRKLRQQQDTLDQDFLPVDLGDRITAVNALKFRDFIQHHTQGQENSFLLYRIQQALDCLRNRQSLEYIRHHMNFQAEADANSVEGSYSMLRVIIWAIPILGFIGTVMGIGMAVGGFSDAIADVQAIDDLKRSLGKVTIGLGVAFDTTFLALMVSLFIMFFCSSMQKAEEDFLGAIERYCSDHLLARIEDPQPLQDATQDILRSFEKLIEQHAAHITRLEEAILLALPGNGTAPARPGL